MFSHSNHDKGIITKKKIVGTLKIKESTHYETYKFILLNFSVISSKIKMNKILLSKSQVSILEVLRLVQLSGEIVSKVFVILNNQ